MIIVDLILSIILLFFPTFILMVYFILKIKETSKKIKYYEKLFGVVFTEEVLEDMKNIPPESYNYNPAVFVPEYNVTENNTQKEDFTQFLFSAETEESEEGIKE
jgi:hypothetical protein